MCTAWRSIPVGNVYIADTHNARIRKIIPRAGQHLHTSRVTAPIGYSGDGGPATNAELTLPAGVAVDFGGNVYIADYGNYTVRKVDTKGNISTFAGTGVWGYSEVTAGPRTKRRSPRHTRSRSIPRATSISPIWATPTSGKITTDGNIQTVVSNISAGQHRGGRRGQHLLSRLSHHPQSGKFSRTARSSP